MRSLNIGPGPKLRGPVNMVMLAFCRLGTGDGD